MKEEPVLIIGGLPYKETNAEGTTNLLEHVKKNAVAKGLTVNEKKTALMCVSAARSFDARVEMKFGGQLIKGKDSLRILGVTLDRDCTFATHVEDLAKRIRARTWALSRLKRKGMKEEDLVQAYKSTIRPVVEYASPVWHSLLTATQSERLERQQTQALKNIYGVGTSAQKMRKNAGVERLWTRRENVCVMFARKNLENVRCSNWFVRRPTPAYGRRLGATYNIYKDRKRGK